jgi:hypothetical protein
LRTALEIIPFFETARFSFPVKLEIGDWIISLWILHLFFKPRSKLAEMQISNEWFTCKKKHFSVQEKRNKGLKSIVFQKGSKICSDNRFDSMTNDQFELKNLNVENLRQFLSVQNPFLWILLLPCFENRLIILIIHILSNCIQRKYKQSPPYSTYVACFSPTLEWCFKWKLDYFN